MGILNGLIGCAAVVVALMRLGLMMQGTDADDYTVLALCGAVAVMAVSNGMLRKQLRFWDPR